MPSYFITGSSRGIGLGIVTQLIIAAAEETSKLLPNGLDYFISNAASSKQLLTTFEKLDPKLFVDELLNHTVPNLNLTHAFHPLIAKSNEKKALFITSDLGSLTGAPIRPNLATPYSVGKSALNMLVRKWGTAVKDQGSIPVLVHPGWVATDLGYEIDSWVQQHFPGLKHITTEQSVAGVLKVIQEAKMQEGVLYLNYDGAVIPW